MTDDRSRVRFGTAWNLFDHHAYIGAVKAAERAGFDLVGMGDSQSVCLDPYSLLTVAAEHTQHVMVGPLVTNPVTRHPSVTAGALASLQQLSAGRAFLGLSGGHTSVLTIGERPATVQEVATYGVAVRSLTTGDTVEWNGTALHMEWPTERVPLYLTPEGPKGLRLAGRIADGVFINTGVSEGVVRDALDRVRAGAIEVGRDPNDIDIWMSIRGFMITDKPDDALAAFSRSLAITLDHVFSFTLDGKSVPDHLRDALTAFRSDYLHQALVTPDGAAYNEALLSRHGLLEWALDRFTVFGPVGHCIDRLQDLRGLGIDNFFIPDRGTDPGAFIETIGEVIGALR